MDNLGKPNNAYKPLTSLKFFEKKESTLLQFLKPSTPPWGYLS